MFRVPVGFAVLLLIVSHALRTEPQGPLCGIFLGRKQKFWLHIFPIQELLQVLSLLFQRLESHPEREKGVLQSTVPQGQNILWQLGGYDLHGGVGHGIAQAGIPLHFREQFLNGVLPAAIPGADMISCDDPVPELILAGSRDIVPVLSDPQNRGPWFTGRMPI